MAKPATAQSVVDVQSEPAPGQTKVTELAFETNGELRIANRADPTTKPTTKNIQSRVSNELPEEGPKNLMVLLQEEEMEKGVSVDDESVRFWARK